MTPIQLLQLEWKKFAPNGTFRMLIICYVAFFSLLVYLSFLIGNSANLSFNGNSFNPTQDLFVFPRLWELIAYLGSWVNVTVLGFMGVFMITLELNNRTLRQNVISGLNRGEVFRAKIVTMVALALSVTLIYLVLGLVAGLLGTKGTNWIDAVPSLGGILRYAMQSLGYLLLGTLAGFFIRQTALATIAYFSYVCFLEWMIRGILYLTITKSTLLLYLPNQVLKSLVPLPLPQMARDLVGSQKIFEGLSNPEIWLASLAYLTIFSYLLSARLRRSDL